MYPSALPPGCGDWGAGVGPAIYFCFVTAAGAFLPAITFSAFASCLHRSRESRYPGWSNVGQAVFHQLLDELVKKLMFKAVIALSLQTYLLYLCFLAPLPFFSVLNLLAACVGFTYLLLLFPWY